MLKKYFRKIVDVIFGKRCECLITKAYTPVKCVICGKEQ